MIEREDETEELSERMVGDEDEGSAWATAFGGGKPKQGAEEDDPLNVARMAILQRIAQIGAESEPGEDGMPPPEVQAEQEQLRLMLGDDDALQKLLAEIQKEG